MTRRDYLKWTWCYACKRPLNLDTEEHHHLVIALALCPECMHPGAARCANRGDSWCYGGLPHPEPGSPLPPRGAGG